MEAANNPNISFKLIEEIARTILLKKIGIISDNAFGITGFQFGAQVLCNFFKEFVKQGEKDVVTIIWFMKCWRIKPYAINLSLWVSEHAGVQDGKRKF